MFGLSMKEKLYKAFVNLCAEKLPVFEKEMRDLLLHAEGMGEEEAVLAYAAALHHYSNAISETIHQGLGPNETFRFSMAVMRPSSTGLPDDYDSEFGNSPFAGKFFAIYYYAITGKQIELSDYGKYIRPINKRQIDLVNGVLQKLGE